MDPNLMRHIEYFSVPNNQTGNPIDRAGALSRPAAPQTLSPWNISSLNATGGPSLDPSNSQNGTSFEEFQQAQNQSAGGISFSPPQRQRSIYNQGPRTVLPTRTPKAAKDKHERKRSKLSTDATPFDSVDYWLQFDNEEGVQDEPAGDSMAKTENQTTSDKPGTAGTDRQRGNKPSAAKEGPTQSNQATVEETVDDSALDNALSDEEENFSNINLAEHLSKIDSVAPSEVPQREGLYSTPLSWERPQPGLRMDSIMSIQSPATLDQAEQRRLIAIAMNPGSSTGGLGSSLASQYQFDPGLSALGSGLGTASMSQIMNMGGTPQSARPPAMYPPNHPPRAGSMSEKGKEKAGKPGDRTAHNDIERKYRTNLKDKIAELRDAVPALRTIPENEVDDGEDGGQPSRGPKVSKGAVLTKATEYIHYLEKKNKAIVQQHQELSRRLQAFEQLLSATARPTYQMPNYSRTLFDPRAFC